MVKIKYFDDVICHLIFLIRHYLIPTALRTLDQMPGTGEVDSLWNLQDKAKGRKRKHECSRETALWEEHKASRFTEGKTCSFYARQKSVCPKSFMKQEHNKIYLQSADSLDGH